MLGRARGEAPRTTASSSRITPTCSLASRQIQEHACAISPLRSISPSVLLTGSSAISLQPDTSPGSGTGAETVTRSILTSRFAILWQRSGSSASSLSYCSTRKRSTAPGEGVPGGSRGTRLDAAQRSGEAAKDPPARTGPLPRRPTTSRVITAVITNAWPYGSRSSAFVERSLRMEHVHDLNTRLTRLRASSGFCQVEVRVLSDAPRMLRPGSRTTITIAKA
jgi:hypothetical protein